MITTIVVPVDDSPTCERALPVAEALARATGARIELLTVDPLGVDPAWADHRLGELADRVRPGVEVRTSVEATTDTVATALAGLDRDAGTVVCVAPHGRGPLASVVLGSVTDAMVRRSHRPVLVVGPGVRIPDAVARRPVVAAVDGSDRDHAVLGTALDWARATGARLEVVHVVTRPSVAEAWRTADDILATAEATAQAAGVAVTTSLVAATDPDEGVLRALGAGAGCVVVGTHRRTGVGRLLMGSAVTTLTRRAPCPVLVAAVPELVGAGAPGEVDDAHDG